MIGVFRFILLAMLTAAVASPAWGQDLKVGFVNLQKAMSESKRGKDARASFQADLKDKQEALSREKKAIEKQQKDLEKQARLMKESERARAQRRLQLRVRDWERKTRDVREELALRERELTDEILKDLQKIIGELGKTGKFTMILERSQMLYTDKGTDVTDDVIKLYNERFQNGTADKNR